MWSGADRLFLLFVMQHGTGHGFGSFLTVHEGPQSFSSSVPLVAGHVITNEPGFCKSAFFFFTIRGHEADKRITSDNEGKWGMRIESALVVRRVTVRVF